ncbi:hypothetical protein TRIATDRAFT_90752 [Trichoderma atroviride IMI 206040]|uniref:Berberine/berberine-like domain-containing protein n=1 Tax=Hypocrea atroviridis (strain ATCC 20476 / IMI 206040) TaxID=452589 RepID=G9NQ80_HYPAI|nr:uncharacterized protein TRIATDRAFT_90752 [Trichoderma atroviride IMI 206040]EHK47227.1 hypothetical protein TRIATDRAFT_90752 [Trichoderma atroviride IMI 206040]
MATLTPLSHLQICIYMPCSFSLYFYFIAQFSQIVPACRIFQQMLRISQKPLIDISLLWSWTDIQHDERISQVADQFVENVEEAARAQATFHRCQHLNYAVGHQDVYGGYGEKNRRRLLEISSKYDPDRLMPKMRPGIIQLSGSQKV